MPLVLTALAAVGVCAVAASYFMLGDNGKATDNLLTHTVQRGRFIHDVVERGEIESSSNTEIRCEVKSKDANSIGVAILDVIEEGSRVQPGDLLVQLDSSTLEQQRVEQLILCSQSEALMITSQNAYGAAVIAKKEYEEGTFRQEEQIIQSELFVAEENLRRARQYAAFSERLAAKGYVTALQLEGDKFAVEKARNEVDTARTKLRVLQEYTKEKTVMTLEADIKTAEAQSRADRESYQLERDKLKDIEEQIAKCEIRAPQAGTVVYANKQSRRSDSEFVVESGALVRERQIIIRLPDPRYMQVKALISESRVTLVKAGMKVTIRLDAFEDETLHGDVVKVNEYPEPGSWFSSQVKEYATFIEIFDPPPMLRPGLTAEVRIHITEQDGVLQLPVQAIHEHGKKLYCMLRQEGGWKAREIEIGASNDKFVLVNNGIRENDQVAMNPRALLDEVNLPVVVTEPQESLAAAALGREPGEAGAVATDREPRATPAGDGQGGLDLASEDSRPLDIVGDVLARLDSDGDGRLSNDELTRGEAEEYVEADTNHDGLVDRSELSAAVTRAMEHSTDPAHGSPAGGGLP